MKLGSLFSGCGGLDMAVNSVFGSETAWHCEFEDAPSKVLANLWPAVPNHRDVTAVDWSQVEPVDILAGGFPCQDLSLAGRRAGMRPGTRSGLWSDFVKAIDALKPSVVVIENVRGLLSGCAEGGTNEDGSPMEPCPGCVGDGEHRPVLRALGRVLGDLAGLGFDAEWGGIRAADIGAPHGRFRVFVLAYSRRVLGEGRFAASVEAQGGRASAVVAGRDRAPVELPDGAFMFSTPDTMPDAPNKNSNRVKQPGGLNDQVMSLFRTPAAAEAEGGPRNPDREGATMRLSDQVREEQGRGLLLPTPVAQPSGNSPEDHLRKKPGREVVTDLAIMAEHGLFESGGRLLPTPKAGDADMGLPRTSGRPPERSTHLATRIAYDTDGVNWGPYEPAVRRWEAATRPAPLPTKGDGRDGKHRLSSEFVEWMQGYPAGHVTGHGLTRSEELRILGNTVVPQQGAEAVRQLWARAAAAMDEAVAS